MSKAMGQSKEWSTAPNPRFYESSYITILDWYVILISVLIGQQPKLRAGSPKSDPAIQPLPMCPAGGFSLLSALAKLGGRVRAEEAASPLQVVVVNTQESSREDDGGEGEINEDRHIQTCWSFWILYIGIYN